MQSEERAVVLIIFCFCAMIAYAVNSCNRVEEARIKAKAQCVDLGGE